MTNKCTTCNGPCDTRSKMCRTCWQTRDRLVCPLCGIEHDRSAFRSASGRRLPFCPSCLKTWHKIYKLRKQYGLTHDEYLHMLESQKHACAICKVHVTQAPKGYLLVDHDHVTGHVRGLLCNNCNAGIGMLKDSAELLKSAIKYLDTPADKEVSSKKGKPNA